MVGRSYLGIVLATVFMLVHSVYAGEICFDYETAGRMVVELERCRITFQQLDLLQKENEELRKQIELLKQIVELQKEQVKISQQTVENIQKICEVKTKEMEKACKPSFWANLKDRILFSLAGILLGVIITH